MLYVLVGPTCSGKTTVLNKLKELGYKTIVNYTTRPKRENEINGVDYNFLTENQYYHLAEKNLLVAERCFVSVYGTSWFYAMNINDIDLNRDSIAIVDVKGCDNLVKKLGKGNFKCIYLNIDYQTRLERGTQRNDDVAELKRRLAADEEDFNNFEKKADYIITNINLKEIIDEIITIIKENNFKKKKLILISPLPPSVNKYLNYKVGSKKSGLKVQAYSSDETKLYKDYFTDYTREEIRLQNWIKPPEGKLVFVRCIFYFDKKGKDPNNYLKVPFDVFTAAGVYIDDDIALPVVDRVYIDSKNPRIEFEIYESDAIGIFENKFDYQNFLEKNCYCCNRKNYMVCGVLRSALENRITDDICSHECQKKK
jgi:crossover junction endodeoxyribonuclease RusA